MPPSSGKAQLFTDRDYGGAVTIVEEGMYRLGTSTGAVGKDTVSSLKVAPGYAVTVYSGGNFQGASATFTADTADVGDAFRDGISSVQVSAASTASTASDWFDEGRPPDWFEGG
jgi:hypothetical protein